MTFSYLSRGIRKLFPTDHTELAKNGGLFLSKIFEKDREHFLKELNSNSEKSEIFAPAGLPFHHPDKLSMFSMSERDYYGNKKLLGYDGVFIDMADSHCRAPFIELGMERGTRHSDQRASS